MTETIARDHERYPAKYKKMIEVDICGGETFDLPHGQRILTQDGDKAMFIGTSVSKIAEVLLWYLKDGEYYIRSFSRIGKPLDKQYLMICGFEKL